MPEKINFTKRSIEALPPHEHGKPKNVYDTAVNGLLVVVSPKGKKIFKVRKSVNGKTQAVYLGEYPMMTPVQARELATVVLGELMKTQVQHPLVIKALGLSTSAPAPESAPVVVPVPSPVIPTLQQVFHDYLKARRKLRHTTIEDYERCLRVGFCDWLEEPITAISEKRVELRHAQRSQESKARADNEARVLRSLFNFAKREYKDAHHEPLIKTNPVEQLSHARSWNKVPRKETYLSEHDLKQWLEAVNTLPQWYNGALATVARVYFLLVLFNGYRRTECSLLTWDKIDFERETITLEQTKNGKRHTLPLTPATKTLLQVWLQQSPHKTGLVFRATDGERPLQHIDAIVKAIRQRIGKHWALHDLRRTFSTLAHSGGMDSYIIKRLLNHTDGSDVTLGYVISDVEQKKEPLAWIADTLLEQNGLS